jgi:hypothetical protein
MNPHIDGIDCWGILVKQAAKNCNKIAAVFIIKKSHFMRRFILLSLLAFPVYAVDERPPELEAVPEAPEPPMPIQNGETMEPDITIIRKGKDTIQEYRRAGRLYMIKVIPAVGPPYYFLDTNGDGKMDVRRNDLDNGSEINMWKLLEW